MLRSVGGKGTHTSVDKLEVFAKASVPMIDPCCFLSHSSNGWKAHDGHFLAVGKRWCYQRLQRPLESWIHDWWYLDHKRGVHEKAEVFAFSSRYLVEAVPTTLVRVMHRTVFTCLLTEAGSDDIETNIASTVELSLPADKARCFPGCVGRRGPLGPLRP